MSISLGYVSAEDIEDTNSTIVSIDENSQIIENKEVLTSPETENVLDAGDVSLNIVNQKESYAKSESVKVKMGTYTMASSGDSVSVYLNGKNIATTSYSIITNSGYDVALTNAKTGSNSIYCSFTASGIWALTSDTVNFIVSDGGSDVNPSEDASATITIWDMDYPSQDTITSNGDYVSDIAYSIVKSGDGFSDESLEVIVNDESVGFTTPNAFNRLGNLTFTEDKEWKLKIIYTATVNGKTVNATSNTLTFITRNTSGGNESEDNNSSNESTAYISIYDLNNPSLSTITSDGDYVADIAYSIVKSGDGFTDESLEIFVNNQSFGSVTPNASNRLGSLTITEDNEWVVKVVYTAIVNGKIVNVTSNSITFITRNTSGNGSSANGTGGDTPTPEPDVIQIIIRDANYPTNQTITLTDKYGANIQYYVVIPSGSLLTNEIIIKCNNVAIKTYENPVNATYTSFGGTFLLNETGDYVFEAEYMYNVFMSDVHGSVYSNKLTYHINIENKTDTEPDAVPTLTINIDDVNYPNQATAIVNSNVDGDYTIIIGENNYNVTVDNGTGQISFILPPYNYTATVVSKTNSSLMNHTTFTVNPKAKITPTISSNVIIDGGKAVISISLPNDITDEKITVTLNNGNPKEATLVNGVTSVEFNGLSTGDYSYRIDYTGNDDYNPANSVKTFEIPLHSNGTGDNNQSGSDTNGSSSDNNQSSFEKSTIVADNLTRAYNSPYDFKATFYDNDGNPLANAEVNFIINGNDNIVKTDELGVAKLVKKLPAGNYIVEIRNLATGEVLNRTTSIVIRIANNKNINVDYSYAKTYSVKVFADNGQVAGARESVVMTLNNVKYTVKTNKNGVASLKISNLLPKTYTITAEYRGVKVSNKVVVKQVLKAKNKKFKRYKVKKYSATLKTSAGKAIKGKKITFKIKGKTYKAKTNAKGIATIKIKGLYKLGKHKITIGYLKTSIKKTVTVKK